MSSKNAYFSLHNNHKKWQLHKFKQQIYLEFPHLSQIMETVNLIEIYLKTYCFSQYFFWFFLLWWNFTLHIFKGFFSTSWILWIDFCLIILFGLFLFFFISIFIRMKTLGAVSNSGKSYFICLTDCGIRLINFPLQQSYHGITITII